MTDFNFHHFNVHPGNQQANQQPEKFTHNNLLHVESLLTEYSLNQLDLHFKPENDTSLPTFSLHEQFCNPSLRLKFLHDLPLKLQQFLAASKVSTSNIELSLAIVIPQKIQKAMVKQANLAPFSSHNKPVHSFEELQQRLTRNQFDSTCCVCIIQSALCTDGKETSSELAILQEGINLAYIASLIAQEQDLNPLHLFLTAIIRSISLVLIDQSLRHQDNLPSKKQFSLDMKAVLARLDYWFAKDLGLPDTLLYTLKSKLFSNESIPQTVKILYLAEHCQCSLLLGEQDLINNKETQDIIHNLGLADLNFIHPSLHRQH